ncbi:hypothetical protein DSECCO2_634100 [anaerobic digester metagenome]
MFDLELSSLNPASFRVITFPFMLLLSASCRRIPYFEFCALLLLIKQLVAPDSKIPAFSESSTPKPLKVTLSPVISTGLSAGSDGLTIVFSGFLESDQILTCLSILRFST